MRVRAEDPIASKPRHHSASASSENHPHQPPTPGLPLAASVPSTAMLTGLARPETVATIRVCYQVTPAAG